MVYATNGTHLRHVHTEKHVTLTLTVHDLFLYFELLYILLLYYDVNVMDVFPPTKSDAFVVKIGRVCGKMT
jgi:hypothetical protein